MPQARGVDTDGLIRVDAREGDVQAHALHVGAQLLHVERVPLGQQPRHKQEAQVLPSRAFGQRQCIERLGGERTSRLRRERLVHVLEDEREIELWPLAAEILASRAHATHAARLARLGGQSVAAATRATVDTGGDDGVPDAVDQIGQDRRRAMPVAAADARGVERLLLHSIPGLDLLGLEPQQPADVAPAVRLQIGVRTRPRLQLAL